MKKRLIAALVPLFAVGGVSVTLVGSNPSEACAQADDDCVGVDVACCWSADDPRWPNCGYNWLAED